MDSFHDPARPTLDHRAVNPRIRSLLSSIESPQAAPDLRAAEHRPGPAFWLRRVGLGARGGGLFTPRRDLCGGPKVGGEEGKEAGVSRPTTPRKSFGHQEHTSRNLAIGVLHLAHMDKVGQHLCSACHFSSMSGRQGCNAQTEMQLRIRAGERVFGSIL